MRKQRKIDKFLIAILENQSWVSYKTRGNFISKYMKRSGSDIEIYAHVHIEHLDDFVCGSRVSINNNSWFNAYGGITIGDDILIGPNVIIHSSNHNIPSKDSKIRGSGHNKRPVFIQDDVWIGANVIILPGVTIGEGSVVGAGSVVTKDVLPYTIVAGNPAVKIRVRE